METDIANDEVCFWHANKHQIFLQDDAIILDVGNQACPE